MDRRGRSRDVSPVALARTALRDPSHSIPNHPRPPPQPHFSCFRGPSPTQPSAAHPPSLPGPSKLPSYDSRARVTSGFLQPVAPSSRHPPPPSPQQPSNLSLSSSPTDTLSRTHSSTSVLSTISEPNPPEPLTPPDANDYAYTCQRPLEYYDSPPSPPRTLQDQMQVAYALEQMHLAKILLLKLRGIEVSGDNDPRIAQVRDEDFSSSFVPAGGLRPDEATEARLREAERRAREAQKRREREERLRRCERTWESSAQRLKVEKARIARQREEEAQARRRAEREARERQRQRERARKEEAARAARQAQLRIASGPPRQLLSYDSLRNADTRFPKPSPTRERGDDTSTLFLYDIMPSPPSRPASLSRSCSVSPTDKDCLSLPRVQRELALQHAKSVSRSIPFSDVLTAMHGPLFDDVNFRPHTRPNSHQAELLAILMAPLETAKADAKGKGREIILRRTGSQRREHVKASAAARTARSSTVESLSSTSSGTSSSASTVTRPGSWFSFGSRSSPRSASTAITSPSTSPHVPTKSVLQSSAPPSSSSPSMESTGAPRPSAKRPVALAVSASDHPLALPAPPQPKAREPLAIGRGRPLTRQAGPSGQPADDSPPRASRLVHRVSRSVSSIMDFAAQFQKAYVKAAMFSAGVDLYTRARSDSRSRSSSSGSRSRSKSPKRATRVRCASVPVRGRSGGLRPEGYRACSIDVQLFTAADMTAEESQPPLQRTLIPLCSPSVGAIPAYERALQNVCRMYGIPWQSRSRDLVAGGFKEKVLGVAWEGVGRSGLGWEVTATY
ncbi:hypothetical protein BD414DRAFT_508691 [Trametes punicea]|nr:hypothetical protein BD414DRAFT_508691 [Trametes punicea]